MVEITELNIVEDKSLREQVAGRVEVLDKVKELFLLPELEMMTMQQLADYYEVEYDVIRKCYNRYRSEITSDGARKNTVKSTLFRLGQDVPSKIGKGFREFYLSDDVTLRIPYAGIILFPKRAILRVGMLLRDSEVAKEVRTQLLNTFEHATVEARIEELDRELRLAKESNRMLTGEVLRWDSRSAVNAAVRLIAREMDVQPQIVWTKLHEELYGKHRINLNSRRNRAKKNKWGSLISFIKDDEWPAVQKSLAAICERCGMSPAEIFEKSKLE